FWTCWRFDDAVAEGFHSRFGPRQRHTQASTASYEMGLGNHVGLDHFDPGSPFHGGKVFGSGLYLFLGQAPSDVDHLTRIALSFIPTGPCAGLEIVELLQDVHGGQARGSGVIGTALAIGVVAEAA